MNKLIQEQLEKVKNVDLSHFDEKTNTFFIPKLTKEPLKEDICYIIKLDSKLLYHNDSSVLESNWNRGTIPPCQFLKADVVRIMNGMVKVNSIGYDKDKDVDLPTNWEGWLPINQIEVIAKL